MSKVAILATMALALSAGEAFAVSAVVKKACKSDYIAYCSQHKVGSPGVKSCMRAHRKMLLDKCIKALRSSGEVTKKDVRRYNREKKRN